MYFIVAGHSRVDKPIRPTRPRSCSNPAFFNVTRHFRGRIDELSKISEGLKQSHLPGVPARFAVHGMSGFGKTQLLMQYAQSAITTEEYQHIFWIAADTESKLLDGFCNILNELEHPLQHCQNQNDKATATRIWLEEASQSQSWLLVIDNVTKSVAVRLHNIIPTKNQHGHIIITTRWMDIAQTFVKESTPETSILALQGLRLEDATDLLLDVAGLSLQSVSSEDRAKAQALVERTGCHPLAISFAGAGAISASSLTDLLNWTDRDQLRLVRSLYFYISSHVDGLTLNRSPNGQMRLPRKTKEL